MYTYISNNCASLTMFFTQDRQYDNPFIGCLFVNDADYVKFCRNFSYYTSLVPTFGDPRVDSVWARQNGSPWYKNEEIKPGYPVMYLDEIEIHWIHETDKSKLFDKYYRRLSRFLKNKPVPIFMFGYSELCNNHTEIELEKLVSEFVKIPTSIYLTNKKSDLKLENNLGKVVYIPRWEGIVEIRNSSHILNLHTLGDRLVDFRERIGEMEKNGVGK